MSDSPKTHRSLGLLILIAAVAGLGLLALGVRNTDPVDRVPASEAEPQSAKVASIVPAASDAATAPSPETPRPSPKMREVMVIPAAPPVAPAMPIPNAAAPESEPATATAPTPEPKAVLTPNQKFGEDIVSIEALGWKMQSSHQYYEGHERPSSLGFGVRGLHWFDKYGVEGYLRTDLFGLNRAGGRSEITDLEARAHRRWFTRSPFSAARRLQFSALAGVERFRNARSDVYSQGYDLFKVGVTAMVPIGEHWGLSGELGLGFDPHGSRKYEAQYMVQYFWDRTWSLGAGYRINLFEARTASQAPGGLFPYREGYTEIRSALTYHF